MRFLSKVPVALILFLGLSAIGYQAYELNKVWKEGSHSAMPEVSAATDSPAGTDQGAAPMSLSSLAELHLMGDPAEPRPEDPVRAGSVETSLKLELVGTIRSTLGDGDSALIAIIGGETKRYYVGDLVESGAYLESVGEDKVVLRRGEQLETLRYSKTGASARNIAVRPMPPALQEPLAQEEALNEKAEAIVEDRASMTTGKQPVRKVPEAIQVKGLNRSLLPDDE